MKILLPDVLPMRPELPSGIEVVVYEARRPVPEDHADAEILVSWGHGGDVLAENARRLSRVRLVQGLAAGSDALLAAGFGPKVELCSGVGLHDRPVAEHALALILALVRRLPACAAAQAQARWAEEFAGVQPLHPPGPVTTLLDARVLLWGFGGIAATLAPMLDALGARVRGVARSPGERAGFEILAEADLDAALAEADVLVDILPATPATAHALDARRLRLLPDHAYVVNVGRGATLDEAALVAALHAGTIAGAALDVMETEPLPADSPLWSAPNLVLTPHCAGGRPIGADDLVSHNVAALLHGAPLRNALDR